MPDSWKIFAKRTLKLEERYLPLVRKVISDFRSSFINLYLSNPSAASAHLTTLLPSPELASILQSMYKAAGLMGAKMAHQELKQQALQKAATMGRNEEWVQAVMKYLNDHLIQFVSDITDTMRNDIVKVLQKGIDNSWTYDQVVAELRKQNLVQARARVIARTEINRAANAGHAVGAASSPYEVVKRWSAAGDHRTRHSHVLANGQIVDELETFKVAVMKGDVVEGYDQMQFPGDPTAHGANTINCRCRVVYQPKRDAQGKLIFRSQSAQIIPISRGNKPTSIPAHQIAAALKAHIRIGVDLGE